MTINRRDFLKIMGGLLPAMKITTINSSWQDNGSPTGKEDLPSLLIIIFDALSAKHMSLYGYPRNTTPNISKFADQATVYHHHYSTSNFTTPGTASILTGTYPWTHRAYHINGQVTNSFTANNVFSLTNNSISSNWGYTENPLTYTLLYQYKRYLDELVPLWITTFGNKNLQTIFQKDQNVALVESTLVQNTFGENPSTLLFWGAIKYISLAIKQTLLNRSFKAQYPRGVPNNNIGGYFFLEDAIDWLTEQIQKSPKPFLGYMHFYPPHNPYTTRYDFINLFRDDYVPVTKPVHPLVENARPQEELNILRQQYDEYIAFVDAEFNRILSQVDENTIIILTSDHGELFERGFWGHLTPLLYEPLIHVPLLIKTPGQKKRNDIHLATSHTDLLPTILQWYRLPIPQWIEGETLPPFNERYTKRKLFAMHTSNSPKLDMSQIGTLAVIDYPWKFIYSFGNPAYQDKGELYNLTSDPEEMEDLSSHELGLYKEYLEFSRDTLKGHK